jgi:hypothetical protein
MPQTRYRLTVFLEKREDGGLRVFSDDLPGLILSGREPERIASAIVPVIQRLFEARGYANVSVHPLRPVSELLHGSRQEQEFGVNVLHDLIRDEQFVVEVANLAA